MSLPTITRWILESRKLTPHPKRGELPQKTWEAKKRPKETNFVQVSPDASESWICWAFAARRNTNIGDAQTILLDAEIQHPNDATIQFNLGCYACVMGNLAEAKRRGSAAIDLDSRFRTLALDAPDLQPLRKETQRDFLF